MKKSVVYYLLLIGILIIYGVPSKLLFDKINDTIQVVVDEEYHLPQGMAYCERNFTYWHPKITTLPGLYLTSTTFLGSYFKCNTYNLRIVNLAASCINLILFSSILRYVYGNNNENHLKTVLQSLTLVLLPPLYFFSHIYYTDTLSLLYLLAYFRLSITNYHKFFIVILGLCSILMRQTNIAWIAMLFGYKSLELMIKSSRVLGNKYLSNLSLSKKSSIAYDYDKSKLRRYYNMKDLVVALQYHFTTYFKGFFKLITRNDIFILLTHGSLLLTFIAFLCINGSIVVGDRDAHKATLHIPQIFYFLVFYGIFGLPHVVLRLKSTLNLVYQNKLLFLSLLAASLVIIHYNTIVHPYLLADNRHFTFYVWNRWYGKYFYAKYISAPFYIFLLFSLYDNLQSQNCISFLAPYSVCVFIVLCLQKMIEVRYFLIPYLILRLRFSRPNLVLVFSELLWYLLLNAASFQVFFNKEFMWKDYNYAQRIIW